MFYCGTSRISVRFVVSPCFCVRDSQEGRALLFNEILCPQNVSGPQVVLRLKAHPRAVVLMLFSSSKSWKETGQ